ncbi:MAG: ATP-binding protein, partial [Thermoanaerobaculia bacterium]
MDSRSSLVSRFAASTAVLVAAVVVLAVVFFVVLHSDYFHGTMNAMLRGFTLSMAEVIWRDPDLAQKVAHRHKVGIILVTPDGRVAFGPDGEPIDPEEQLRAGSRYQRIDTTGPDGRQMSFFWDKLEFVRLYRPLLVGLFVLLLVMIGATYAFQLAQLRPLRWLRTGVAAVSRGDFTTRVPVVRQDEIGQVAQAFNQMTRRVEQMINDRERLLGDVSHELRSPLARIKVALELLPESDKRDLITKDVRAMESLTAVLLERERVRSVAARTRADGREAEFVDLAAVVREVVDGFVDRPPGVELADPTASMEVRADAALMGVLIQNLVDNAIKFSLPDSQPVEVRLRSSNAAVELVVSDDGRGIPEAETERVFEPFVKLDPARGHRTGYGLGLDLCRRIVEAHDGSIELGGRGGKRG